tara:strand:- start:1311 stop:2327 length:1017 start_codon:yes stop_codon:yes gene_type:complete
MIFKKIFFYLFIIFINSSCGKKDVSEADDTNNKFKSDIVAKNGLLRVVGNKIVNKNNIPISLAGNSFFWSNDNWGGQRYYTPEVLEWLNIDWNTTIVRAAMGVDEPGGYLSNRSSNKNRIKTIVEAAIDQGIYVIIDWHSHHAENFTDDAILFFEEMASLYGDYENIIYEIYNEPLDISWSEVLKPYSLNVISAIREIDPDNLIIVGTPEWSQRVDLAAEDPITEFSNIAYTLHFYTVYHHEWLRERASQALSKGIALFVTEWGSLGYTLIDSEADKWMNWCFANKITHLNWAVNDKEEEWSILRPGASQLGNWSDSDLTDAGKLAKDIISNWPSDLD